MPLQFFTQIDPVTVAGGVTESSTHGSENPTLAALELFSNLLMVVTLVGTLVGNSLTLIAIARNRNLQTISNYLIGSLAVADLLNGVMMLGFFLVAFEFQCRQFIHDIFTIFMHVPVSASMLHLLLIAVDRCLAIQYHVTYPEIMTARRAKLLVAAAWLVSALSYGSAATWFVEKADLCRDYSQSFITHMILAEIVWFDVSVVVITPAYVMLLVVMVRQRRKIAAQQLPEVSMVMRESEAGAAETRNAESTVVKNTNKAITRGAGRSRKSVKPTVMLFLLMCAYIVLWTPYFVYTSVKYIGGLIPESETSKVILNLLLSVGFSNSAVNTVIYALMSTEYRAAYSRLFRAACSCCSRP